MSKKKLPLPLLILVICLIIGLLIAGFGLYKQNDTKRINKERRASALKESQKNVAVANKRLEEIKTEIAPLKEKFEAKKQECDAMDISDSNWFANHSKCQREASEIDSQISELETEQWKLENDDYTVYYSLVKPMSYQIFYIIGGSIAGLGSIVAFIIYLVKGKKTY